MDESRVDHLSTLFKALADPARLRILGLLAEKPHAGHELAARLALTAPTISHHMRKLADAGLVSAAADAQSRIYSLCTEPLRAAAGTIADNGSSGDRASEEDAVLRAFFDGGRLKQIPASRKKRVVVLRRLLELFAPGRDYSEREVNELLRSAHDDVASLRRELVDYGFMTRDRGIYRVATELPQRGVTVAQEVGDETRWFRELVAGATARAIAPTPRTRPEPPE
ncbi:MAG: metalloregulator ArsR/SmtB family transcription factor [Thermomicrobiales bacterium]|nr:metalloregulator ArsR/SmtB family transcription factor [Thermomicrobiales bacterium]